MDLTSLSSTLPNNARQSNDLPSTELMSAFKQAALSVTTLYKNANSEIERSRKLGYQECLDDLLHLINSDRIHLNSEVVKIREWCLSKRRRAGVDDASGYRPSEPVEESEDERARSRSVESSIPMHSDPAAPATVSSPPIQTQRTTDRNCQTDSAPQSSPPVGNQFTPLSPHQPQMQRTSHKDTHSLFSFRSNRRLPQHPPPPPSVPIFEDIELPDPTPDSPIPLAEQSLHHFNHSNFSPTAHRGPTGGWKRRLPYEFIELAAMAEKEKLQYGNFDYNGSKRGRMT